MIMFKGFIFKSLTNNCNNNNKFSNLVNSIYQDNIDNKDLNNCRCSKCFSVGDYEIKGYYYRNIVLCFTKVRIRITRVECQSCNRTHALFFEDFIPYFSLTTFNCLEVYLNSFCSLYYDYDLLLRLKDRFFTFINFLKSIKKSILNISECNNKTIGSFRKSYLQIHRGLISFVT